MLHNVIPTQNHRPQRSLSVALWVFALMIYLVVFLSGAQAALAHASLLQSSPQPDSILKAPPEEIKLVFSERLERELYYIRLFDSNGKRVAASEAEISLDQRELSLPLPSLPEGLYTISYKVISADGHPIQEAYLFTVGTPAGASPSSPAAAHEHHALTSDLELAQAFIFAARILYFLTLLLVTGWVLWRILHRIDPLSPLHTNIRRISLHLRGSFLLAVVLMIASQLGDYIALSQFDELLALVTGTAVGLSWAGSLLLALLSFIVVNRNRWVDGLWVSLLWTAETLNGHAAATEPVLLSAALNFIHLAGASLWAGGLLYILVLRRVDRPMLYRFLPRFSSTALWSLTALVITGSLFTLYVLPDLRLLWQAEWGVLLLIKIGLVLLVFIVAALIRQRIHARTEDRLGNLLKIDFVLMIAIVFIVGLFTYISPVPANKPVFYHDALADTHLVLKISPNAPGESNHFYVEFWLPADEEAPELTALSMHYLDGDDIHPIEVPLHYSHQDTDASSPDFIHYYYTSNGPYLPFAGDWEAQIRIQQPDKKEIMFLYIFTNFAL